MSRVKKLRAGGSELTRFKALWLSPEFVASRDYWREQFVSSRSQAELRAELKRALGINLARDNQLSEFRAWAEAQAQRELMAEKIEERKQELLSGGMSLTEAQDVLLAEASAYSVAARDFKLGLRVSAEISKAASTKLDYQKFMRETPEMFLKWYADRRAGEIANSTASNADKIERLGQLMFGEDWKS